MNAVPHSRRIWLPTTTDTVDSIGRPSVPNWARALRVSLAELSERRSTRREWRREERHAVGDLYMTGTSRGSILHKRRR